jgi:hypothetical protein
LQAYHTVNSHNKLYYSDLKERLSNKNKRAAVRASPQTQLDLKSYLDYPFMFPRVEDHGAVQRTTALRRRGTLLWELS